MIARVLVGGRSRPREGVEERVRFGPGRVSLSVPLEPIILSTLEFGSLVSTLRVRTK